MNFFEQGLPLGNWFRIRVVIHWTFLLYAAFSIMQERTNVGVHIAYMAILFGTVLLHEFGHALSCRWVGGESPLIILWPLGGLAFVQPPPKPWAHLVTTVCGPLVNAILWPVCWALFVYVGEPRLESGAPISQIERYFWIGVLIAWQINKMLLLFNLIPAYPMDGGRILQEILWMAIGYGKSLMIAGMIGTCCGVAFVLIGLGVVKLDRNIPVIGLLQGPNPNLIIIGILGAMQSFAIYRRSQEISGWRKN